MTDFDQTTGEVLEQRQMPAAIAKAIIAVKKEVKQLGADDRNPHGGYPFVSVDKFYDVIGRLMAKHGLATIMDETAADVRAREGGTAAWLFTHYDVRLMAETGELSDPVRRSCFLPISGPQAFGAAQSYIEKQYLRQLFKVPTGEKDADVTDNREDVEVPVRPASRSAPRAASAGNGAAKPTLASVVESPEKQQARDLCKTLIKDIGDAMTEEDLDAAGCEERCNEVDAAVQAAAGHEKAQQMMRDIDKRIAARRDTIRRMRQGQEDMGL